MDVLKDFLQRLGEDERSLFTSWRTVEDVQAYLDAIPYSPEDANRCPRRVLVDRQAHCLDGALLAAAGLRLLGYPPLILDLQPDPGKDDDHVLAIFRIEGAYGALAKSNCSGLRYRAPVYRSLRELVMSYFEDYFNTNGERTLRYYTRPQNLRAWDGLNWMWEDSGADAIEERLRLAPRRVLLTPRMAGALPPVDRRTYEAGFLGADPDGLYRPRC